MGNKDVECAYIKVNLLDGGARSNLQDYIVRIEDIGYYIKLIILTLKKYGINCSESMIDRLPAPASIVYVSSFDWVTESSIYTEDRVIESTINFAKSVLKKEIDNELNDSSIKTK